jgi:hypothetical protein
LIWVAVIAGLLFLIVHATWLRYFAKPKVFVNDASPEVVPIIPKHVPRHSLVARLFHWIMAASMFTLLFTAFLPRVGIQFPWVTYHWIAGAVLTVSNRVSHHSRLFLDGFLGDLARQNGCGRCMEKSSPVCRSLRATAAKVCQVSAGEQALPRRHHRGRPVSDPYRRFHDVSRSYNLFPRNPYLFSDMTWGLMYVLHGLAGVGLIALIMMHVYFGLRPEKRAITKSMIFGWMDRDFYLKEHDPKRWVIDTSSSPSTSDRVEDRGLTDAD